MTKMSKAQMFLMNDILQFDKQKSISIYDVSASLSRNNIEFTQKELDHFYNSLKFKGIKSDALSPLEVYANGHLFRLDPSKRCNLRHKIAVHCGMNKSDLDIFEKFAMRLNVIGDLSSERNCLLYVDAE